MNASEGSVEVVQRLMFNLAVILADECEIVRKRFEATEAKLEYFGWKFIRIATISMLGVCYIPLLRPTYRYFTGSYSPTDWFLPFAVT